MSTRVYRYGLLPPSLAADRVSEQMRLAHVYQNRLVELERERRRRIAEVQADDAIRAIDARLAAKDEPASPLWAERKLLLQARRDLPHVQVAVREINADMRGEVRAARKTCDVYWGTYLQIEAAVEAAARHPVPPKFRGWRGEGAVAVQLQNGMPVPDLLAGHDRRVALDIVPAAVPGRGGKPLPRLRLRVGSEGRDPLWAEWPIVYHRPLPLGAALKWAKVVLRRIATREEWSVHFTVEEAPRPAGASVPAGRELVAVELGGEGDCAGRWSDGERCGVLALPPAIAGALRKAADLEAIRTRHLDQLRAYLLPLRDDDRHAPWPYKLREQADRMPAWEAPARFQVFATWWAANRFPGDDGAFSRVAAWRQRDNHLWLWAAHARLRAQRRRRDVFRGFAVALARQYARLALPKIGAVSADEAGETSPRPQLVAAPSELRGALVNAFAREGRQIIDVAADNAAAMCIAARAARCSTRPQEAARSVRFNRLHRRIEPAKQAIASA